MRITLDEAYGGELVSPHDKYYIYLDGEKQRLCICADDESGEIVRAKTNPDGSLRSIKGSVQYEIVLGDVRIVRW